MYNFKKSLAAAAVAASLGSLAVPAIAADNTTGYISGVSRADNGNILTGVTVTIKNTDTGLTRSKVSDASGEFRFPLLPPGKYTVEGSKDGYAVFKQDKISVGIGGRTNIRLTMRPAGYEQIEVRGSSVAQFDVTSSESSLVVDQEFVSRVPVARDVTSVALLAPGTTAGDGDFGNLASFGGSSVAENAYFLNGLNITNFRNGLGGSRVPFEFYDTFEVKTGGYSAEFGRSTGGVVNATTKSGSNEFEWGASAYFEPDSLSAHNPDIRRPDGSLYWVNHADKTSEYDINIHASGAMIQDKLFYYVLLNPRRLNNDFAGASTYSEDSTSDFFWGTKLDWYITDDHMLELTAFSDSRTTDRKQWNYDPEARTLGSYRGEAEYERGGSNFALKYTGILSDDFTLSAMYGINKFDRSNRGDSTAPLITDRTTGASWGNWVVSSPNNADDQRTAFRIDADWYVGDHSIRFGIDYEELEANENTMYSGGVFYRYQNNDPVTGVPTRVRVRHYENSGGFKTESNAFYVQDSWAVTDTLTINAGLRNESFENFNVAGTAFVKVEDQWAPRLGLAWDVSGDGESKIFANWGRYFLPVATNTNIRLAGAEYFIQTYCDVVSVDPTTALPTLAEPGCGDSIQAGTTVYADGTVKSTDESVNSNLDPMYQDEWILGYQFSINDDWSATVKGIHRDLKSSLEDIAIDKGFNDYIMSEFGSACTACSGFHYYVLTNPGGDVTVTTDPDYDGPVPHGTYTIPADVLGYPEAVRKYSAIELGVNRQWQDDWTLSVNYTWAHSYGNNEGFVRSDNGQDDAGLTTNFDQPGLTDGAYGNLPNDRRHTFKVFGAYEVFEDFKVGVNFLWESGRPKNAFGFHPTDTFASWYEAASFANNGQIVSRGSIGNLSSRWKMDVTASYDVAFGDTDVNFRVDVFNLFNNDKPTEIDEVAEQYGGGDPDTGRYLGAPNQEYGLSSAFQNPRFVRLSASVQF